MPRERGIISPAYFGARTPRHSEMHGFFGAVVQARKPYVPSFNLSLGWRHRHPPMVRTSTQDPT